MNQVKKQKASKMKIFNHFLQKIGVTLAGLRINLGYPTIKAFASDYDLPLIQYWRVEKGKANITLKTLFQLLTIHQLSMDEFFIMVKNN